MRLVGFYVFAAVVALLPVLFPTNYFVTVVGASAGLHVILAVGLNLLMGYAGQISLGHAAFFGMGAYASAILTTRFGWYSLPALATGLLIAGTVAWLLARPILRLRGHYLAMATLGFGIIVHVIMVQATRWTGGPDGLAGVPPLNLLGWAVEGDLQWYGVIMAAMLLTVWLSLNLVDSQVGRALRAVHGSEFAAQMMGIDIGRAKTQVFVVSALFAAFAGSLFAHQQAFVSPDSFNLIVSVELVTMVVLGGMASTFGAACGAIALTLLHQGLVVFEDYEMVIHGALLMAVMIFLPQGLFVGLSQGTRRLWAMRPKS
ncbi:MAG: branched-chain amino acid ABC transporter permease [Candidatus Contendobacter sp.]|nr:branched-chain amino acid ABC transporter permease [Candidatus Contendobacter sp.]MDS4060309.1 branched-chain amino acid ABC transporter permease [Candidatus Contendobacter sp.]